MSSSKKSNTESKRGSFWGTSVVIKQQWKRDSVTGMKVSTIGEGEERHPSWFEAVFDLIIVASFSALGDGLQEDLVSSDWLMQYGAPLVYFLQFSPIYTHWSIVDNYNNRYGLDGLFGGLIIFAHVITIGFMNVALLSLNTMEDVEGRMNAIHYYAYCNVAGNLIHGLMHYRVASLTEYKYINYGYTVVHAVHAIMWMGIRFLTWNPYCMYALWVLIVVLEHERVGTYIWVADNILVPRFKFEAKFVPIDVELFAERNGLMIILAIGECFMATLVTATGLNISSHINVVLASFHAFMLKLAYFDVFDIVGEEAKTHALRKSSKSGLAWTRFQLFTVIGITCSSMLLKRVDEPDIIIPVSERCLFGLSMCVVLQSLWFCSLCHERDTDLESIHPWIRYLILCLVCGVIMTMCAVIEWYDSFFLEFFVDSLFAMVLIIEYHARNSGMENYERDSEKLKEMHPHDHGHHKKDFTVSSKMRQENNVKQNNTPKFAVVLDPNENDDQNVKSTTIKAANLMNLFPGVQSEQNYQAIPRDSKE